MPVAAFACAYVCACTSFLLLLLLVNGELVGLPKPVFGSLTSTGKGIQISKVQFGVKIRIILENGNRNWVNPQGYDDKYVDLLPLQAVGRADTLVDTSQFFSSVYMGSVVFSCLRSPKLEWRLRILDLYWTFALYLLYLFILDFGLSSIWSARSFVPPVGGSKLGENVAEMAGAVRCFNISFQLTTFTCITLGFRLVRPLSLQLYSHLTMHTIFN